MRIVISIIFILLYFGNYQITSWIVPGDLSDYDVWLSWYDTRNVIIQFMYMVGASIALTKKSLMGNSLVVFAVVLISCGAVDKIQGISTYHIHDILAISISIIFSIAYYTYHHERKN
jgi:hypothetical protein